MAINIKLVDNYRLLSDSHNWIIAKEDNGRLVDLKYFTTLKNAIDGFVEMKIRGYNSTSLLSLQNSIKSLQDSCNRTLHNLKLEGEGIK